MFWPPLLAVGQQPEVDEVAKWKAQSRKHEAEAKANAKAAEKLAAIEASKTELDKAAERASAAEARAAASSRSTV